MPGDAIDEQLAQAAERAWQLSASLCDGCRAYHGLWPWLRLAGLRRGLERDRPLLLPALRRLIGEGRPRVLVAGAADSGLAALVLEAAGDQPLALSVVDRCATPLVLCQELGARLGRPLAIAVADLTADALGENQADLILAHALLSHLPAGAQVGALAGMRRALRHDGRLLLVIRLRGRSDVPDPADFARRLAAGLAGAGLTPPAEAAFATAVASHAVLRGTQAPFASLDAAQAAFAAAGLRPESLTPLEPASGARGGYLALLRAG